MALELKRNLIMLDKQPVISLPRGWVEFWKLHKKQSLKIMCNSILIIIPPNHPDIRNIENRVKNLLVYENKGEKL